VSGGGYLVSALGARGDGIITVDDKPRFIPNAVPGDVVHLDASGAVSHLEPGQNHAAPRCSPYERCGGCSLQHLSDDLYAYWIKIAITRALQQHDLTADILPAKVTPPKTRRRCTLSGRWKGQSFILGFAGEKSHDLADLPDCSVLAPDLHALIAPLQALMQGYVQKRQNLRVSLTLAANGVDVLLEGIDFDDVNLRQDVAAFAQTHRQLCRVVGRDRGFTDILYQTEAPFMRFSGAMVALPIGAFTQATPQGEAALVDCIMAALGTPKSIADLFSGIGTLSCALAQSGKVDAYEGSKAAVDALHKARLLKGAHGLTAHHRDLFRRPLTARELGQYDTVVLDPPRAGAKAQCETIAGSKCEQVLYVSCNPNTFARDAHMLVSGGFSLKEIQPVGQFLWSQHIELMARFER